MKITKVEKDAALHFRTYLQAKGHLDENRTISKQNLFDVFANVYQPKFHSHLHRGNLLPALAAGRAIIRKKKVQTDNIVFKLDTNPQNKPPPESKPQRKVFVNEEFVFKHPPEKPPGFSGNRCNICKENFNSQDGFDNHLNDATHSFREQYRKAKNKFSREVDGIEIRFSEMEDERGNLNIILRENEDSKRITIEVVNTGNKTEYILNNIVKICDLPEVKLHTGMVEQAVVPGLPIRYKLESYFTIPGAYVYPIVFVFCPIDSSNRETSVKWVLREIVFRMQSELMDILKPTSPFHRPQKNIISIEEGPILEGIPLISTRQRPPIVVHLKNYKIPQLINTLLKSKLQPLGENMTKELERKLKEVKDLLGNGKSYKDSLTVKNYVERFHLLLYLEEFKMNVDIREYDRTNQVLEEHGTMFYLEVKGLSENRPSVLRGDVIYVCKAGDRSLLRYEGIVHEVREEKVLLGFHKDLQKIYLPNMKFDVFFTINTFPLRMVHRALDLIGKQEAADMFFPQQNNAASRPTPSHNFVWFYKPIAENPEQQQAVKNIVNRTSSPAPYLVFGPPGTGKTVTLVEAICQVWHLYKSDRVKQLVCAPSNTACDVITKRLLKHIPKDAKLLRMYAMNISFGKICEEFKTARIINMEGGDIYIPTKEEIMSKDIVVCTSTTAGRLVTVGVPPHHFAYVFVDECGQAIEPEVLIPFARILTDVNVKRSGQIVLAGDPKQLGPILRSRLASEMGLGMSLLERLMEHNPLYHKNQATGKFNSHYLTKLVQNYRSHKCILDVSNRCFYDNELQVKGDVNEISKALRWEHLPKPGFPIVFHGVAGKDERESTSPSYFNRQEIDKVVHYLRSLIGQKLSGYKVDENDIGIITPYRKQVQKFQLICRRLGWQKLKIGSVEEFQGDEKLIIIVSTVRSNQNLVEEDYRFNLGFLKNPKRFNVAVTRAKALLIVVGNPRVLRCDPHWYELLRYCQENGAITGLNIPLSDPPPPPPNFQQSLVMDFAAMSLSGDGAHPEGGMPFRQEQ